MEKMNRFLTRSLPRVFTEEEASFIYEYLNNSISWEEGVRSRKHGHTRLAKSMSLLEDEVVAAVVTQAFHAAGMSKVSIGGIYLNYYRNGEDFTPQHTHKDSKQLIISLGATRVLNVGKKKYPMNSGDVILFGSSIHGIEKEPQVTEGRISIAVFFQ